MEKTRPMREEMQKKGVYFPPELTFLLQGFSDESTFRYLYLDLACKLSCFPPWKRYILEKRKYQKDKLE